MSTVVTVENLGKKYTISHQQREDHSSLRDAISNKLRLLGNRLCDPFYRTLSPQTSSQLSTSEDFWALKDVSFEVKQGDRIGIIGGNGAGKSTLLKILSRITAPTTGRVRIRGRVASLLEVGTGFHPELTGRENIYLNGAILGMQREEIRRKFDEIVDFSEIEIFLDTPVKRYSSGMYVRLAFAVAAHLEPEILIVDEVLAVGDTQFQKKCLGKMEEVGREGRTVLFVSHNMGAIRSLCSRVLILEQGTLFLDAKSAVAVDSYLGGEIEHVLLREWRDDALAPQNSSSSLLRIAACDRVGHLLQSITTDTEIRIEVDFKVICAGTSVGMTLILYDIDNSCVFSSISNSEPNWYGVTMPVGTYRSICVIPGRLLNNRRYSVTLNLFGRSFADLVTVSDVLKLDVSDGAEVRRDYFGEYGGYIRPDLCWTTERLCEEKLS